MPAIRYMLGNASLYVSFFIAAAVISLSLPRNLLLQYVPSAYTSGGVVSLMGAGVLGLAAVVLANVINGFLSSILG